MNWSQSQTNVILLIASWQAAVRKSRSCWKLCIFIIFSQCFPVKRFFNLLPVGLWPSAHTFPSVSPLKRELLPTTQQTLGYSRRQHEANAFQRLLSVLLVTTTPEMSTSSVKRKDKTDELRPHATSWSISCFQCRQHVHLYWRQFGSRSQCVFILTHSSRFYTLPKLLFYCNFILLLLLFYLFYFIISSIIIIFWSQ